MSDTTTSMSRRFLAQYFSIEYAGQTNSVWSLRLQEHEDLSMAGTPDVWAHIIARHRGIRGGDIIQVRSHDNSMFAELFVRDVSPTWMKVAPIRMESFNTTAAVPAGSSLVTKWNVGSQAYDVVRANDRSVVRPGFKLKEDAVAWIADHLKQMAA